MSQESPTTSTAPQYRIHDGKAHQLREESLYAIWEPLSVPEGPVHPIWKGAKIPFAIWAQLRAWCEITQEKFKSEALALLFYDRDANDGAGEWHYWFPPQETNGMTVKALPDDPRYSQERRAFPDLMLGSLHHHCTMSAFQSGTDRSDEANKDGLHFTIGTLGSAKYTVHARLCIEDHSYDIPPETVIDGPPWLASVPPEFRGELLTRLITAPTDATTLAVYRPRLELELAKIEKSRWTGNNHYANNNNTGGAWKKKFQTGVWGQTEFPALGSGVRGPHPMDEDDYCGAFGNGSQGSVNGFEHSKRIVDLPADLEAQMEKDLANPFPKGVDTAHMAEVLLKVIRKNFRYLCIGFDPATFDIGDLRDGIALYGSDPSNTHNKRADKEMDANAQLLIATLLLPHETVAMKPDDVWDAVVARVEFLADYENPKR